jgi:hypothetical protein
MREAYLTGQDRPEPEPPTMEEALKAIECEKALQAQIKEMEDKLKRDRLPIHELHKKSGNFPYKIMEVLGFAVGQVRKHIETGEEVVVIRNRAGVHDMGINGLTKRRTILHYDSRRITPLNYHLWADTGRRVTPRGMFGDRYYGIYVPKGAPNETLLPFPL